MNEFSYEILNGNELIIQGAREAGFNLYTGYPGSPLADYFNILYHSKKEFHDAGIRVVIANSEANAAAMASGAKQANRHAIVAMKSMGLHVAADALSVGNFANPGTGGVVIVVGDDPWSISTSAPADSRYLFKHLHIPFLDPSTPQELKDWIKIALDLSKKTSVYQGLLLTTFMAEGGGRVKVYPKIEIDGALSDLDPSTFDLSKNVMVPPNSLKADIAMINERFPLVIEALKAANLDLKFGNMESKIGFISSGATFEILKHVLDDNHALERFSLYKVAAPYPLISELLLPYLSKLETLIVVEEKRGFLENEIYEIISKNNLKIKVIGKKLDNESNEDAFISHGGLNYDLVASIITKIFNKLNLTPCHNSSPGVQLNSALPKRLPTFCPGCPHRETLSLLKDLRLNLKKQNINLISHGDVGCYSLSFLEPFKEMHNLSAMGQGGALGAGVDLFTTNPSVVLMGDSTFFHSGITDISNSVQCDHNITYILLDNDNTAMTGHQMSPASGISVEGYKRPKQDMLNLVNALGVTKAIEVNPSDRYFYQNLLRETLSLKGVKVIISNKECGLTFHGRKKNSERFVFNSNKTIPVQTFYQINTDACEDCRECVTQTGCPGLTQVFDAYGSKVAIDSQICVADSYCTKIKACPSFERVDVFDFHPNKFKHKQLQHFDFSELVEPQRIKTFDSIAAGIDYRVVVTGVGGSGVTTISKILSTAAIKMNNREDLEFKFVDQKGLAQRNGNVTGHLMIFKKGKSQSQITPLGGADILLSPDLLDGSQHLGFLSSTGTIILDQNFQVPLTLLLDKGESGKPITENGLSKDLQTLLGDRLKIIDLKKTSELILGKSVYASSMILGAAYQLGLIPFLQNDILESIHNSVPKLEVENNVLAFNIGRMKVQNPTKEYFSYKIKKVETDLYLESIKSSFLFSDKSSLYHEKLNQLENILSPFGISKDHCAKYVHDIIVYDGGIYLDEYIASIKKLIEMYIDKNDLLILSLRTLTRTYFIKDEVFIAHQMISPIRTSSDHDLYSRLGLRYKKSFINRPSFDLSENKKIEFDFSPQVWMLKAMRHSRFIRKILPVWHKKERLINHKIREKILLKPLDYGSLKKIENIKGYREVRFLASELL